MEIPKGPYNPTETEAKILAFWLESKFYKPEYDPSQDRVLNKDEQDGREAFTIVLPPPNANGNLHLGHMSGYAYQDIMARFNRMNGKRVLLLPGKDHAGIQTEVVFEREIEKQGKDKQEMGRDAFYEACYQFCMDSAATARSQEQNIGLSADFDRELFTLDPRVVDEVLEAFRLMYEDGLIYRGKRLINWCPRCQSALAEIDTEYKEQKDGKFFYFKYAFTEPDKKAIALKSKYLGQSVAFIQTAGTIEGTTWLSRGRFETNDGEQVLPLGFTFGEKMTDQEFTGKAIGLEMRLDGNINLLVLNPEFQGTLKEEIWQLFEKYNSYAYRIPGVHYILFEEYSEDKFLTNGFILGTVRPETKFGDTALAVSKDDNHYQDFVGKKFTLQTLNGTAEMTIIADEAVDPEFGTGMVKVTPAHSPDDWNIAQRHPQETMPEKQVIDFHGKLNHLTGKYKGMSVDEAREKMIGDMRELGMLVHLDEHYMNRIQICERCKTRIEPLISFQWFVDTRPLKAKAKELVEAGETNIMPEGQMRRYIQWMESEEDWCITRQLWWGYRIPVWYKGEAKEYIDETGQVQEKIGDKIISSPEDYKQLMKVTPENPGDGWIQDEDVLDTWFSSGQWPYVTLKVHGDLDTHYPTDVMETGWDILIFWVTRMMMLNPYRRQRDGHTSQDEQIPFKDVYLHGLVLDKEGQKMSKSKGNGIDPFEMMQKYGTDALRFSFVIGNAAGQNYRLYEEKIDANKKFCNKVWNASKFAAMNLEGFDPEGKAAPQLEDLKIESNKALWEHVLNVSSDVTRLIETFQFGIAAQVLHNEFWHTFADIHIEAAKPHVYTQKDKETGAIIREPEPEAKAETQRVLYFAIRTYIQMLHPFIPFITEEIWKFIPKMKEDHRSLMYCSWPRYQ